MRILKLLSDWMVVEEEAVDRTTVSGIILPNPDAQPVRIGKVIQAGPGRRYTDRLIPMPEDIVGQRVVFLAGASDTKQGQTLKTLMDDGRRLIRLGDVLGIADGATRVTK